MSISSTIAKQEAEVQRLIDLGEEGLLCGFGVSLLNQRIQELEILQQKSIACRTGSDTKATCRVLGCTQSGGD